MRRIAMLAALLWIAGCGEGPRHLSKFDYEHGKDMFDILRMYEGMSKDSLSNQETLSSLTEIEVRSAELKDESLKRDLRDYAISVLYKAVACNRRKLAAQHIATGDAGSGDINWGNVEIMASFEPTLIDPIIKRCHNDAAQYFDANALNTNTCHDKLVKFEQEYKKTSLVDAR
jgi:hypothetical protein